MNSDEIIAKNNELFAELKNYPENSKKYRDIVAKIVENNVPLVIHVAKRYFPTLNGSTLSSDDLVSEGLLALLKAVKYFKIEKGVPFANYAAQCIANEISTLVREEQTHKTSSLEDNIVTYESGNKLKIEDVLASPVNVEEDVVEKDEVKRQMAWVRKNLDQLTSIQKQVLIAKYLSGETMLTDNALAKEFDCTRQNISLVDRKAIESLRKMYYDPHPEKIVLTPEEKIAEREVLKNLILTKLAPKQKATMLCKFYTPAQKTNGQVAQEINSSKTCVSENVKKATKKLCTIYNGIQDKKHLTSKAIRDILQFRAEESEKEC